MQTTRSVAQALRPFPQYGTINTTNSGGDKTGRSNYHAGILKVTQRLSDGFMIQGSYTYSKLMTDADSFSGSSGSMDTAQPELEYSIGRLDQTHSIKLSTVYELPFGPGRRWLNSGVAGQILGGWRVAAIQNYASGLPIGVTTSAPLPIFNGTNRPNMTGADWRAPTRGRRIRSARRSVSSIGRRSSQPVARAGQCAPHERRRAPAVEPDREHERREDHPISSQLRLDVRMEVFNLFNRVVWGAPNTDFNSTNFGLINSQGEFAAADAVRPEAVLVGDDFSAGAATVRRAGRSISLMRMTAGLGAASTASHSRMRPRSPARVSVVVSAAHVTA